MGKDLNVKFGASLVIVVMLMASIVGFIGIGTAATEDKDFNEATGPIMISKDNLRKVDITAPELLVPRVYPTITKTAGNPYPSPQAFPFLDADTTRCVLNELYATMDYGGLLPAIKGAYNDLDNGMYTTSEAFFMEWHCDMEQILVPPPPPWNDTEYDPGHYMFVPPWSDSCARILQPAPLGLDITLWQILTGAGEYVPVPSAAVDGEIYEYPGIYYQDALESTAGGSVGEIRRDDIQAMTDARLATETPVTIAVNGTFDDATDWGNMTVTVAAIGDLPTSNIWVDFFIAEEHNSEIEVRFNPIDGNAANEDWSNKNYYMNKVGRRWAGAGEPNAGGPYALFNKTDTITYVDVPFDDHWQWGGASMGWIGNNLWLVGTVINGDTGEVLQTSAFSIGNPTPDLYMTPVDIYAPTIGTVVNETVHGPTVDGGTGPLSLDYGNIIDCTLYIDLDGSEWLMLSEGADYFLDYATGTIDTSPIEPFEAGWTFYGYYNYTLPPPNEGDIQPFDVTVSNTGNGAAGASTLEITDGDGGPLVDTLAIPALAAGESTTQVWAFDTAGYPGYHTLCFIPDGPDAIAESDENNNIAPYDIYIAPPIDVGVASIDSLVDMGTYEWGNLAIDATVSNYGQNPQGPFDTLFRVMQGNTQYILDDDVEGGNLGWTPDPEWAIRALGANSPTQSWDFGNGDYGEGWDAKLTFGPFDLSTATVATWSWFHSYDFEAGWDGGVLDVSPDGAAWTRVVSANGYDGNLGTGWGQPIDGDAGSPAFTGTSGGFVQDSVDLTPWVGDNTVWLRYWAGTDTFTTANWGWRIDDIQIYMQSFTTVFSDIKTTSGTLDQLQTEQLSTSYNFAQEDEWIVSVMTMLPTDTVAANNETVITIFTVNSLPPGPPTDLQTILGGAATIYQEAISDIAVENDGITNDYLATLRPVDGSTEDITELLVAGGGWTTLFTETFTGTTDANWLGDDGGETTPSDEYWHVEEAAGDTADIRVGAYRAGNTDNELDFIDCDADWAGQWAAGMYGGAANYYDMTGYTQGRITFQNMGTVNAAAEGWRLELTRDGGGTWPVVAIEEVDAAATHGWQPYQYDLVAADLASTLFGFRFNVAGSGPGDYCTFDDVVVEGFAAAAPMYSLEHQWQFQNVPAGDTHMFYADVGFTGAEDNFEYYYSQTGAFAGEEVGMFIDATAAIDLLSYDLGPAFSGNFYVAVRDTDSADAAADVVNIDCMYVETTQSFNPNDCTLTWTLSADDGAGSNDVTGYDIYRADSAAGNWYEGAFVYEATVPAGTNFWADVGEGLDLVDNIWYYVIATDGTFDSLPTGTVSKFDTLPEAYNVLADGVSPLSIPIGTPTITLTANIRDNTTTDENIMPFLTGGEWFDPLSGDSGVIATPDDGTWDGPYEGITVVIDTSLWVGGDHPVNVRGNSPYGWGPTGIVIVTVTAPTYNIDLAGVLADTWVFVSFPIEATGDVTTVFNDAVHGDGGTTWDYIQWYDNQNKEWRSYSIDKPAPINDMDIIDNTFGFWIHITANAGDEWLTIGSGNMPAGPVLINLYTGWNLVGYPSTTPRAGDVTLPAEANLVSVYDLVEPYRIRDELKGAVIFTEGNAYWVRVTSNCVWIVNP